MLCIFFLFYIKIVVLHTDGLVVAEQCLQEPQTFLLFTLPCQQIGWGHSRSWDSLPCPTWKE